MLEKELEILKSLAVPAVQETLKVYTSYMVTSSLVWIVFGLGCIYFCRLAQKKLGNEVEIGWIILTLGLFFGGLIVAGGIIDLLNPQAMAIHQLLKEVRGK
jgi:hypothetical protein